MNYHYAVSHHDEAVDRVELAMHKLDDQDVQREYDLVDFPFRVFFEQYPDVKASYKLRPERKGLEISVILDGDQAAADRIVAEFLTVWSKQKKGLAVVLDARIAPTLK